MEMSLRLFEPSFLDAQLSKSRNHMVRKINAILLHHTTERMQPIPK